MPHPREPFERLLDVFDDSFRRIGEQFGLVFDPRKYHVGRALRMMNDPLKRGVFLDLKTNWMQSDPINPDVVLRYGAWSSSHFLLKSLYDGKLSELTSCIDERLQKAISELKTVSKELINQKGVSFDDLQSGAVETP